MANKLHEAGTLEMEIVSEGRKKEILTTMRKLLVVSNNSFVENECGYT